jgi:hypothetical protein
MAENFDLLDFGPPEPTHTEPEPQLPPDPRETVPAEPEPAAPEPSDEPEGDREAALLARLEEETGRRLQLERELPITDATEPEPEADPDFLKDLDLDEVLSSSENLNRLLLAVYNRGVSESMRRASDNVLGSVQDLVTRYVREQLTMSEMVKEFYEQNEDLRPLRRTVAAYAKEISKEHPELPPQDVFSQTAVKVRTALKLKQIVAPPRASKSFAPQRGRKVNLEPELTGIEKEIMELVDL